jgi:hypothetical protein
MKTSKTIDKRQHNTSCKECGEHFNPYDPCLMAPWDKPRSINLDGFCSQRCYDFFGDRREAAFYLDNA